MTSYATRDKINEKSYTESLPYKMEEIDSSQIDNATYQRRLNRKKVERIAAEFNERVANEPKLSYRDGKYYVFDGHHTVEARKLLIAILASFTASILSVLTLRNVFPL